MRSMVNGGIRLCVLCGCVLGLSEAHTGGVYQPFYYCFLVHVSECQAWLRVADHHTLAQVSAASFPTDGAPITTKWWLPMSCQRVVATNEWLLPMRGCC